MGGPNPINLSNPIHGSGYNPRPEGAAQAPNLKELVLTIDDFRQFASGKYNAGAAPGDQVGAHHAWERLESADIDPSEASAIRLAFAFALEDAGVSGAKMTAACKRLGLEADFSFSENDAKVYTALSREEVRDIMEQSLGGGAVREHDEHSIVDEDDEDNIIIDKPNIIKENNLIEREDPGENHYIGLIEKDDIVERDDLIEKDDVKIKVKAPKPFNVEWKKVAKRNFDKIVELLVARYDEDFGITKDEIEEIVKRVDYWEEKLAECDTDDDAAKLTDLNEDLKDFLMDPKIQEGIDEVIARKKDQ